MPMDRFSPAWSLSAKCMNKDVVLGQTTRINGLNGWIAAFFGLFAVFVAGQIIDTTGRRPVLIAFLSSNIVVKLLLFISCFVPYEIFVVIGPDPTSGGFYFLIHSTSRSKPPAWRVCVCLSRRSVSVCLSRSVCLCLGLSVSVCKSVCLGRAGHTDEHSYDVNNAVSLGLQRRDRDCLAPKPHGQSYTRCRFLSILRAPSKAEV